MDLRPNEPLSHREVFKNHNLKIGQVARAIGRSYCFVSGVLSGNVDASAETLRRLDRLVEYLNQERGE